MRMKSNVYNCSLVTMMEVLVLVTEGLLLSSRGGGGKCKGRGGGAEQIYG